MTAATLPPAPWTTIDPDLEVTLAQLSRRFPGACIWFGNFTGHYWAFIRDRFGRDRLIEATSPADLSLRLGALLTRPPVLIRRPRPVLKAHRDKPSSTRPGHRAQRHPGLLSRALRSLVHRTTAPHGATGGRR
jgi:hypothetical protein